MGKFLGRLGGHEGFAACKLADGSVVESVAGVAGQEVLAYVAACSCPGEASRLVWSGPNEYPPDEAGERAAVDEWGQLHARYLLTTPQVSAVSRNITAMLTQLDALTVESPIAMLRELRRVRSRVDELLALAVGHAQVIGTSWAEIARGLQMSEEAARQQFESDPPTP